MNGESNQGQQKPQTPASENNDFFSRHSKTITRLIIIAIIIVGAAIYARTQDTEPAELTDNQVMDESEENGTEVMTDKDSEDGTSVTVKDSIDKQPEVAVTKETPEVSVKVSGDEIIVVAARGNGYTHLARRALAEYMKTTGDQGLGVEHKIFAEDYLQKKITDRDSLHTGDEISFSESQIQEAIDAAQDLTDAQVQNLSVYVPLVPSLH